MKIVLLAKAFFTVDISHKLYSEDLKDATYKFCKLMDSDDEQGLKNNMSKDKILGD